MTLSVIILTLSNDPNAYRLQSYDKRDSLPYLLLSHEFGLDVAPWLMKLSLASIGLFCFGVVRTANEHHDGLS
jgi:hypothetical protein